jgi:hypothetical protein
MPKGQKPEYRFVVKNSEADDGDSKNWREVGAAWRTATGNFSVRLTIDGQQYQCLMVSAEQKPAPEPAQPKPTTRARKSGPQPA